MSPTNLPSTWTHQLGATGGTGPIQIRLSKELIVSLKSIGRIRQWRRGQTVVHYGEAVSHISICLSGQFSVLLNSIDGHSQLLRYMVEGELLASLRPLPGPPSPRTWCVCKTARPSTYLKQPSKSACGVTPTLRSRLFRTSPLASRNYSASWRPTCCHPCVLGCIRRCGVLLCTMDGRSSTRLESKSEPGRYRIRRSCLAPKGACRSLNEWRRDGLLQLGYRSITLHKRFFEE